MKDSTDSSLFTWNFFASRNNLDRRPEPHLSSIFANWPSQFEHSSIITTNGLDEHIAGESYALTNLGIHIKLRLKRYDHPYYGKKWGRDWQGSTFVAMLDCRYDEGPFAKTCRPGIFLIQISPQRPQYTRIWNGGVVPTTTSREAYKSLASKEVVLFTEEDTLQTIYLRKRKAPDWAQPWGDE